MAKSARSTRGKRVRSSKRILLENQPTWVQEAEQRRKDALAKTIASEKIEPRREKRSVLLEKKREERKLKRKGTTELSLSEKNDETINGSSAGKELEPRSIGFSTEEEKEKAFLNAELTRLKKQVSKRKRRAKEKDSMFQGERKARIKEITKILKAKEKEQNDSDGEPMMIVRTKASRKEKRSGLAVKSGGVTKVKGVSSNPGPIVKDKDDMEEDDDVLEEILEDDESIEAGKVEAKKKEADPNAFDGGVLLKVPKSRRRREKKKIGSNWVQTKKSFRSFHGVKALKRRMNKFEFKGIYQFYPKPQAATKDTPSKAGS